MQQKFEQFVGSEKVKEVYEKYCSEWLKKFLDGRVGDWQQNSVDIIQKYLVELCGEGFVWTYNKTASKAGQTTFKQEAGDIVMTLNLWDYAPEDKKDPVLVQVNLSKLKDQIVGYVFDSIFAMFPFPPAPVTPPRDPVYYPPVVS